MRKSKFDVVKHSIIMVCEFLPFTWIQQLDQIKSNQIKTKQNKGRTLKPCILIIILGCKIYDFINLCLINNPIIVLFNSFEMEEKLLGIEK